MQAYVDTVGPDGAQVKCKDALLMVYSYEYLRYQGRSLHGPRNGR